MVAMASPAPLTRHPIEPSSLMKLRPNLAASTSEASSCEMSRREKTSCGIVNAVRGQRGARTVSGESVRRAF